MHELLALLLPAGAVCGSPSLIAGGLFATALIGSLVHCLPMCGPFVLMQSTSPTEGPLLRRLGGALLLRYQAGRLTTYMGLGLLAGGAGGWVAGQAILRWAPAFLLGLAAVAFLFQATARAASMLAFLSRPLADLVVPLAARQPGGFRFGLLLGLLPCGLLYAALAAAAATGSALGGALAMASFGAGTVPALIVVSLAGRTALSRWRRMAAPAMTGLLLLNALTLSMAASHLLFQS
jgi:sulfite exporter TauE/SafE